MIRHDTNEVRLHGMGEKLSEVWWQGRQWSVTSYGLERRNGTYIIEAQRLDESFRGGYDWTWMRQIGGKAWADLEDFATAYFVACAMHGKTLTAENRESIIEDMDWAADKSLLRMARKIENSKSVSN